MAEEIDAMERNKTWTVTSLLKSHHIVGSKSVNKVKYHIDRNVDCYKARLVSKDYNQQEGIYFPDTFSLVVKIVTVKVLLTLVISFNWELAQMDIYNAFLNECLFKEVYMSLYIGYKTSIVPTKGEKLVC